MIAYKDMNINDVAEIAKMYIETFNSPPWNDKWTTETATKRLSQMINVEDFYGMCAYIDNQLCGMILGSKEQFFDGVMFNIKEFCVKNSLRGQGIGTEILKEFETRLRNCGIGEIILLTSKGDGTEGFYQKRGLESYNGMVMMGKRL